MISALVRPLALAACAASCLSACATTSATSPPASQPLPASEQLGLINRDVQRIEEISALDHQNQVQTKRVKTLEATVDDLQKKLAAALASSEGKSTPEAAPATQVTAQDHRVRVRLSGELVFEPGSARISRAGRKALAAITDVLKTTPSRRIEVAGHTDASPSKKKYEDNWQLSGERARRVVLFLASQGVEPNHLVAIAYAASDPLDGGVSAEAQARNRRVEIYIEPTGESAGGEATPEPPAQ